MLVTDVVIYIGVEMFPGCTAGTSQILQKPQKEAECVKTWPWSPGSSNRVKELVMEPYTFTGAGDLHVTADWSASSTTFPGNLQAGALLRAP